MQMQLHQLLIKNWLDIYKLLIKKSKATLTLVNSIGPPQIGLQFITFTANNRSPTDWTPVHNIHSQH
jgi:hypothetical protein